jgi:aspartate/methionine/tyrosine aminotransferase
MFSLTGWKIGWVTGAAPLINVVAKAHQFLTFTTPPALQLGVAHALEHEMAFTIGMTRELQARRDLLRAGLEKLGFDVLPCEGTYFLTAGIRNFSNEPDTAFCERLVRKAGVALIPLSVFFEEGKPDHLVRFAFCKSQSVLEEALARLERHLAAEGPGRNGTRCD